MWLLCFVAWIPCFLAYYPILLNYDTPSQFAQIVDGIYHTHHPLIHTLFIKLFYDFGNLIGNQNHSFALMSIFQMIIMSGSITYAVYFLRKNGVKTWAWVLVYLWCLLFPAGPILSISITKDIEFIPAFILSFIFMLEYNENVDKKWYIKYYIVLLIMILFRKNGSLALLFMLFILSIFALVKNFFKKHIKFFITTLVAIFIATIISTSIQKIMHAESGGIRDAFGLPIHQMAVTYMEHKDTMDIGDKEFLEKLIPEDFYPTFYKHHATARLVMDCDYMLHNPVETVKRYVGLFFKYPISYIKAFGWLCEGYWNPFDISHSEIYGVNNGRGYVQTQMYDMNGVTVKRHLLLPKVFDFYENIVNYRLYLKNSITALIFSLAIYNYIILISLIIMKKNYNNLAASMFAVGYLITLIIAPAALARYEYPLMVFALVFVCYVVNERTRRM